VCLYRFLPADLTCRFPSADLTKPRLKAPVTNAKAENLARSKEKLGYNIALVLVKSAEGNRQVKSAGRNR
ncbi:MAG: hypothetical protein AAFV46_11985, partial [Cyanobacteria bacterium J06635_11]